MNAPSYFMPYQERWIGDEATLKLAKKSRRVGFTYASSYRMFQKCMTRGKGFTQWVSSRDMLTAQELIRDYVARWCQLANVAAKGMYGDNVQVFDTAKDIKAFVCEFPTGARIVSLSSTPEAFAGKGGDVFLDEVDLHADSGKLVDMAMPCITWGNQLEAVSAYRVDGTKESAWARMVSDAEGEANPQGASLHTVTLDDAIADGLVEKIAETTGIPQSREAFRARMRALCRTQAAWESQFLCMVQDAGGRLIPVAKIAPCEMAPAELSAMVARFPTAPRFAGYDVARRTHACAWQEYVQLGATLYLAERETWHDVDFDTQEAWIRARLVDAGKPRITRLAIDSTGLGMHMAERLGKAFPGRVDAVNLESHRRTELCVMLADRFERMRIVVPEDDQLRADLSGPLRGTAKNGALRVIVPSFDVTDTETGERKTSHCDEFMAAVLANSAADAGAEIPFLPRAFNFRRVV